MGVGVCVCVCVHDMSTREKNHFGYLALEVRKGLEQGSRARLTGTAVA